jgi:hypothetical protein
VTPYSFFVVVVAALPCWQQLIVEREKGNAKFHFLVQTDSPDHIYYRWRTFSLMHGDTMEMWRTEPFQVRFACVCVARVALIGPLGRYTDVPGRTVLVSASTPEQGVGAGGQ